ncbi:hypothetical protein NPIL_458941 [Nephila pilipes]|uniref:Uncharacterized protein n=1 Tax=Nephila pilipes TaxID=299642 RepID=A0A8X6R3C3_NEPPI|nr:hypothetical protein NPIL_458941 [Nephila pilipes]
MRSAQWSYISNREKSKPRRLGLPGSGQNSTIAWKKCWRELCVMTTVSDLIQMFFSHRHNDHSLLLQKIFRDHNPTTVIFGRNSRPTNTCSLMPLLSLDSIPEFEVSQTQSIIITSLKGL